MSSKLLTIDGAGLYCPPGRFHIDPMRPVDRAVITHGHSDHARPGHAHVLATHETLAIMRTRMGAEFAGSSQALAYGETLNVGGVRVRLAPAGHILGSAQVVIEADGCRAVISGDYKRVQDPTCAPFEIVPCDVFVTEATFGLPVFRHEHAETEIGRLLKAREQNPDRAILLGAYGLGKCQRLIALLRAAGYDRPIWLHGALIGCCAVYESFGIPLGELKPATGAKRKELEGEIVIAPPSTLNDRWSRRLPDPLTAFASGWMRVRARARQKGAELPLVISDHADWDELNRTIDETGASDIWVTHGREDALVHHLTQSGRRAKALTLIGFEDEDE